MAMTTTENGTQAIQKSGGASKDLQSFLNSPQVAAKLAEVASKAMKPNDLVRLALMAASRQPDLLKCTQSSILRSLMDAAALGIRPGGLMGRGYLVPRKNKYTQQLECCFDPGWRGLVDIARRSGQIKRIEAHVVHEADEFSIERSPLTTIRHVPSEAADPGPVRAAYAVAEFKDGSIQIEPVMRRDLDKIRKLGAPNGPWSNWYDEMARKTAVRRLCKYLPFDPDLERGMEVATEAEMTEPLARDVAAEALPREPQTKRLANKIASRGVVAEEAAPEWVPGEALPDDDKAETQEREPGEDG